MIRAIPALALVFALLAVACASDDGDANQPSATPPASEASGSATAAPPDCTPARAHAPGETRASIMSGGIDRQYLIDVPDAYAGAAATPLVFVFHPSNGSVEGMAQLTGFGEAAEEAGGWITVYPEGTGDPPEWNVQAFTAGVDDAAFIRELLESLQASLCIDAQRVYATGYSNGGSMALRAACDLKDTFAGVAPVAAPYPSCRAAVPIVAFHGALDPAVPYEGGIAVDGLNHSPVHRSVSEWARAIGCDGLPVISRAAADVEIATYARCPLGDSEALLYTVLHGGHTWPGAAIDYPVDVAGVTTHSISATDLIIEFFEAHPRP